MKNMKPYVVEIFLSTPSVRRATKRLPTPLPAVKNFYPRPPCGGRPAPLATDSSTPEISIHALRAEGDEIHAPVCKCQLISIHALRAEGDGLKG